MGFEFLSIATTGCVATVTMCRPPVNAVNLPMYAEIKGVFSKIRELAPEARVVILAGEGKHFCGGNDLAEFATMTPDNAPIRMLQVREAFISIYDCALPVIAAVRGVAVGTGVALAGSCDLVVAGESARFSLPEIQVGAMGGAKHLSRLVPQGVVRRMHLTADLVTAAELAPYGGIVSVVADADMIEEAHRLANRIARHSPVAIRIAKRSLNQIEYMDLRSGYQFEQSLTGELSGYDDAKEAVAAFFEKREPRYTGR
ncbi:enoyl-CoA hydratase-related protein [Pseudofrankia asymbiotica]|uniref:Crotonase n=1 Tax=Pseudofrankia asymbiotica TaxID=1834516 RepID=A0A1V2I2H2_9ACTN|nr:enoyl-CoA hydratase-related protein [Pseudofrankia asymbiotica]ONH22832.1 crotonase [Pseudofrankia asymbiotica]